MQFYQKNPLPEVIYIRNITDEISEVAKALTDLSGRKVQIKTPTKNYAYIMSLAQKNVEDAIERRMKGSKEVKNFHDAIAQIFHLPFVPEYIEVYDNSHISGTNSIGAMIVAGPNGFEKKYYRKFNIKTAQPKFGGNDYLMMKEVLTRRLKTLDDRKILWLIDGGKAHMGVVKQVLEEKQVNIPYICIAKGPDRNAGREEFFCEFYPSGTTLFGQNEVLHYMQRIRDEAHRFAITTHRAKRGKTMTVSSIDNVPNVGAARKKILLNYFGSVTDLKNASTLDIAVVPGINKKLAETIFNHFNPHNK
jgi:excinuclease ABC subunit C